MRSRGKNKFIFDFSSAPQIGAFGYFWDIIPDMHVYFCDTDREAGTTNSFRDLVTFLTAHICITGCGRLMADGD